MPIHDHSYRRYQGSRESAHRAWLVITVTGLRMLLRRKALWALLLVAWAPFLLRAGQFYASSSLPQASLLAPDASTFRSFLDQQGVFVFLVTIFVGAGLIANDRRANALPLYLSRPMTRVEYVAGKLAILLSMLLAVSWLPGVLLLALQGVLAGSFTFVRAHLYLFPAITLSAWIQSLTAAGTMLALSSLSRNARFTGVLYAGLFFFSDANFALLRLVTGGTSMSWVSVPASLEQLIDVIFRVDPRYDTSPWLSATVVAAVVALSVVVLERRVRGVEVVS